MHGLRRRTPPFAEVADATDGEVDFVFVNTKETGDWRGMVERHGVERFPLAKNIGGSERDGLYRSLIVGGPEGMPITAFYDTQGRLVTTETTAMTRGSITAQLAQMGVDASV